MTDVRRHGFRAMGSWVNVTAVDPTDEVGATIESIFKSYEQACSRFDPTSELSRVNAAPLEWHEVSHELLSTLEAAHAAYVRTNGLFDPRIESVLRSIGYAHSLSDGAQPSALRVVRMGGRGPFSKSPRKALAEPWLPQFDGHRVRVGPLPIDLGGIGKGFTVDIALRRVRDHARAILVEAGGDLACTGTGPSGDGWRVEVENPFAAGQDGIALLEVSDKAVATSSVRLRQWMVNGQQFHHLIDPRTGEPSQQDVVAVTIVDAAAERAEVLSKTLFLHGSKLGSVADAAGVAALWVTRSGAVRISRAMESRVLRITELL